MHTSPIPRVPPAVSFSSARSSRTPKPTTGKRSSHWLVTATTMLAKMLVMRMSKTRVIVLSPEDTAREQCFGFEDLKSVTLHGHADGIIYLAASDNNVVLCNPATREFKKCASPDPGVGALGFGSDPKTRDFKVVNITENGEGDDNDGDDVTPPLQSSHYKTLHSIYRFLEKPKPPTFCLVVYRCCTTRDFVIGREMSN